MKTRRKLKKKVPSGSAKHAKQSFDPKAEERFGTELLNALVSAERHGVIRWVLEAFGAGFRRIEARKEDRYASALDMGRLLRKHLMRREAPLSSSEVTLRLNQLFPGRAEERDPPSVLGSEGGEQVIRVARGKDVGQPIVAAAAFQAASRLKAGCGQDCPPHKSGTR